MSLIVNPKNIFTDTCSKECAYNKYEKKSDDEPAKTIKMCVENYQEHSAYFVEPNKCASECTKYVVIGNDETKCEDT